MGRANREKSAHGIEREASYRAMSEAYAFELGLTLTERGEQVIAAHPDSAEEELSAGRHRWFEAWRVLHERVPDDLAERVLRDAAFRRL